MKTILKGISILILTTYMLGCSNKKVDLNTQEENVKYDALDNSKGNDNQNKEYEPKNIDLSESDRNLLQNLISETCDFHIKSSYWHRENSSIIPDNDRNKALFVYILLCDGALYPKVTTNEFEKEKNGKILVELNFFNKLLKEAFNSEIANPENSQTPEPSENVRYNDGIYQLALSNRGEETISATIENITQVSDNNVQINGTIKSECTIGITYSYKFNAIAKNNKNSVFGGYTLMDLNYDSSADYIINDSNTWYLTINDLKNLSKEQLEFARNEIYARHGYIFNEKKFKEYFSKKGWYNPNPQFKGNDDELNDYEKNNVQLIKSQE